MMNRYKTDIAIVGGGPAGLATADTLQQAGYDAMVLEKGGIADNIAQYPTFMTFFSTADLLELSGFPLIITADKPTRREYLNYLHRFVIEKKLNVKMHHRVDALEGEDGAFRLEGRDRTGEPFCVGAAKVVLATGAFDTPQMLNVPGEDLPNVTHHYREAHPYFGSKTLVIGGRNSAIETALELWRYGVDVSLCHRRPNFDGFGVKYWLKPDIENRIKNGEIKAYMPAHVLEIRPRSAILRVEGEEPREIENDFVIAQTGYGPDPKLLKKFGIEVDPETNRPEHDPETLESNRAGVYMVGVMLQGNISGKIFIENSRTHGRQVLEHLSSGAAEMATP